MSLSILARIKRLFGQQPSPASRSETAELVAAPAAAALAKPAASAATPVEQPIPLTIWMIERDRYGVRGRALSTEIEVIESEAVALCDGVAGYVLHTPNGETVVVEARSGGLVGSSLEAVLDDVRDMASSELVLQIDSNRKEFNRMRSQLLSNEEFWAALRLNEQEPEANQDY